MIPIDPVSNVASDPVKWEAVHPAVTPAHPAVAPAPPVAAPARLEKPADAAQEDQAREPLNLAGHKGGQRAAARPAARPATRADAPVVASPSVGTRVTLSEDLELRETIIRVTDPETGELIRQIPSEESLKLQRRYLEEQQQAQKHERGVA